jgi:FkbM family methyltransferase
MTIDELKKSFSDGHIGKPEFIETAYETFHKTLFEYASHIGHVDIKEIFIDGTGVIFTIRSTGVKIRCQLGDHRSPPIETFNFSDFEPAESRMMEKMFEGRKTFYDIGANIGWHSLNLSAKSRNANFYCFEPIPKTYEQLNENIRLNCADKISAFNIAISDKIGEQKFYYYAACSGNASAANLSDRSDVDEIICQQTTLDTFVLDNSLPPPDFIKCDVEGAELMVIKGGFNTIKKHRPIIMAEILRKWSSKYNYNPNDIFQLLYGAGYLAFTTDGANLFAFEKMTDSTNETNFFFLHSNQHKRLIDQHKHQEKQ